MLTLRILQHVTPTHLPISAAACESAAGLCFREQYRTAVWHMLKSSGLLVRALVHPQVPPLACVFVPGTLPKGT